MKKVICLVVIILSRNAFSCDELLKAFGKECSLQDKIKNLKKPDDLEFYFFYRSQFFKNNSKYLPWSIDLDSWISWELGNHLIKQNNSTSPDQSLRAGFFAILKNVYLEGDKNSRYSTFRLRPPGFKSFTCASLYKKDLDYLTKRFEFQTRKKIPLISIKKSKHCSKFNQVEVSFLDDKEVKPEFDRMWSFAQTEFQKFLKQQSRFSPYELINYLTKWYLAIDPFESGGEISAQLFQIYLASLFKLPAIPLNKYDFLFRDHSTLNKIVLEKLNQMVDKAKNCDGFSNHDPCKNVYDINTVSSSPESISGFTKMREKFLERCYGILNGSCYQFSFFNFATSLNFKHEKRHPYQRALDKKSKECFEVLTIDDFKKNRITKAIEYHPDSLENIRIKEDKCKKNLSPDEKFSIQSYSSDKKVTDEMEAEQDELFVGLFEQEESQEVVEEKDSSPPAEEYKEINRAARGGRRNKKVDNLYLGLKKMTRIAGNLPLWRGLLKDPHFKLGDIVKNRSFMSSSLSYQVAEDFSKDLDIANKKLVLFKIVNHFSAKSIITVSRFPRELEVLFLPGTWFKVLSIEKKDGMVIYTLMEI